MIGRVLSKIARKLSIYRRKKALLKQGVSFLVPNYIFLDVFDESSVVVDVGCGSEAELAIHMVETHSLQAFGVDPTRKHATALKALEEKTQGKFKHINKAVARQKGLLVFHQSMENESGSLLEDHRNVQNDNIESYEVETLTLNDLRGLSENGRIAFLKLDLEGAEYDLLRDVTTADLEGLKQIFVEFHHHCIEEYSTADTLEIVQLIHSTGMNYFTIDDHNYLFYQKADFNTAP